MNTHIQFLVVGVFSVLCIGCAQAPVDNATLEDQLAERNFQVGDPVDRIHDYRIDGWAYVDREHLILHGGVSRRYLVTLAGSCTELRTGEIIGVTTTTSVLTPFDRIVVRSSTGQRRCPIQEIHALVPLEER